MPVLDFYSDLSITLKAYKGLSLQLDNITLGLTKITSANIIKKNMTYNDLPDNETWRVNSVTELIKVRDQFLSIPGFTDAEVKFMLDHICTS